MIEKVKNICGISGNTYDTLINNLIAMYKIPIEKTLKEEYINNILSKPIIELGVCEIIAGHTLNSINRADKDGNMTLSSFTYTPKSIKGDDLIKSGYEKIEPYKKDIYEMGIYSTTLNEKSVF